MEGIIKRFWNRVDMSAGDDCCWDWQGVKRNGYGVMIVQGKKKSTHRFSYELSNGIKLTSDKYVCHKCDNPACCNPKHLFLGTHIDNMSDAIKKGRLNWQTKLLIPRKLTNEQVISARIKYQQGFSVRGMAKKLCVDQKTLRQAIRGVTYAEIHKP
jgi:hypothetical protein